MQTLSYTTFDGLPRTTHVADCKFVGGVGLGYSIESDGRVSVSNCTFRANNSMGKYGVVYGCDMNDCVMESNTNGNGIAYKSYLVNCRVMCNTGIAVNDCELKDCFVETNTTASAIVKDCNMERCVVRGNTITTRFDSGVDICSTYCGHTNVNCLIVDNAYISEYGPILKNKVLVNCTIVDNNAANRNWGRPIDMCALWNCVLWGNKLGSTLCDVRTKTKEGGTYSMSLTNCVFVTSDLNAMDIAADGTVMHEGIGNCRQLSMTALKLVDEPNGDYTPKTRSPLYGTGCEDAWILSLVGSKDFAGNARVFGEGIDIGAYESQINKPGMKFILR